MITCSGKTTHLLLRRLGGSKGQDSCWRKSSKLRLTPQLSQQLHSGGEEVNHNGDNYFDYEDNDFDADDCDLGRAQHPFSLPGASLEEKD